MLDAQLLKGLPLNFQLSIPERIETTRPLHEDEVEIHIDNVYHSAIHQNNNKRVLEGYYKSITRKILPF